MQINTPEMAPLKNTGEIRTGTLKSKLLLSGKEGSLNNYRVTWETAKESWSTPAHRHNFDQIRVPIEGKVEYGKSVAAPLGTVAYFPESIHYGPQFRHDGSITLTIQVGGASGSGFMSSPERKRAFDEMSRKGEFKEGVYSYNDEHGKVHRKEAYEACWEFINQRELKYAPARYSGQVVMNPEHFEWIADSEQKGVCRKMLGIFTEKSLRVGYVQVSAGAKLTLENYKAPQICFVSKGTLTYKDHQLARNTAFGIDENEGPIELFASDDAEILHVQLPLFQE